MKTYLLSFLIGILSFANCKAQISKMYFTEKGVKTNDPQQANSYILIEKVADSAYYVNQFNMQDTILMTGTYSDQQVSTPNGKFKYYYTARITPKTQKAQYKNRTYLQCVGYYKNGLKTGMWVEYNNIGKKTCAYIYDKDQLNGLYQQYNELDGNVIQDGNYINDKKEGEWKLYADGNMLKPVSSTYFLHDKVKHTVVHCQYPDVPENLSNYLKRKLKFQTDTIDIYSIKISFTVNLDGKATDVKLNKSISPEFDNELVNVFINASGFTPGKYDGKPVIMQKVWQWTDFDYNHIIVERRIDSYGRHASLIGRGLNSIGIGKRLD